METALVTGASRGVGRGVAVALADAGFEVFATGRSIDHAGMPSHVHPISCDHSRDDQTAAAFRQVADAAGSLDVLVNSAWGGYERMVEEGKFTWGLPFWEQPDHRWTSMMDAGVRAAFVCSRHAARMMIARKRGLIVNVSFWAARKYIGNTIYGISKAATDKMTADMAHELRLYGVAAVSLYPGLVRTESVLEAAKGGWLDLSNSESPEFVGRVVAALARDPKIMERSGEALVAASVAQEYEVSDVDGRRPEPLTLEKV
ncbi:MAG TPA: SDR family NAD(P)-dependent oxidoreductase [Bryobacteraceae bacterium]|nr:SDR family NAD(P)-dependent oxidoreductase [Bryobacteraceae bacterium]